ESFLQEVVASYVDGKPLHLVNPQRSAFLPISATEFKAQPIRDVLKIFSRQNIVVYGLPQEEKVEFNETAFYDLVPSLDDDIDIQVTDLSIEPIKGNYRARLKVGTARQLLAAHRQDGGKILNALNFPGVVLTHPDLPLSSDVVSWNATRSRKMSQGETYPIPDMRWYLAATHGAAHMWHIDTNGTGTFIESEGVKCWIVAFRKDDSEAFFSDTNCFLPPFDVTTVNKEKWRLEAIILSPGSHFQMRPNTIHSVITINGTICRGGHLFCFSTMQQTAAGLIHSFVAELFITNTDHSATKTVLRRMAELCHLVFVRGRLHDNPRVLAHIPNLNDMEGVLNFLSLCNLVILANVLDGRTYQGWGQEDEKRTKKHLHDIKAYDRNAIPFEEREKYRHARGMCLHMLLWFGARYEATFHDPTGKDVPIDVLCDLVFAYLVQQGRALLLYKQKAEKHKITGYPGRTSKLLSVQLDAVFGIDERLKKGWISSALDQDTTKYSNLLWSGRKDLYFKKTSTANERMGQLFSYCDMKPTLPHFSFGIQCQWIHIA
ncbi:hypothetical protein GALMADRAFT_67271, partial [Galerina marginata CBS 339.88]